MLACESGWPHRSPFASPLPLLLQPRSPGVSAPRPAGLRSAPARIESDGSDRRERRPAGQGGADGRMVVVGVGGGEGGAGKAALGQLAPAPPPGTDLLPACAAA